MADKEIKFALPKGTILKGGEHEYKIVDVLGQGGFGITYKVSSILNVGAIDIKAFFAVKEHFVLGLCHRGKDGKIVECGEGAKDEVDDSLRGFIKEGHLLNEICKLNKHIVDVNEVFESNNTAYYVMKHLDGGDLRHLIKENHGAVSEAKALSLIRPIASAVESLHKKKLLHLDIKPENIVMRLGEDGLPAEPVLIDFGISMHFDEKGNVTTKSKSSGLSEGYSPIEQYGSITTFAPWIDVYALGATCLYLLTGKDPIGAFDIPNGYIENAIPKDVSKRTRNTIISAMQKEYMHRTQNVSDFINNLEGSMSLQAGYVLKGGHCQYRIISVEQQLDNCYVYKAVRYSGDARTLGGNPTQTEKYTIYEFYVKDGDKVTRNLDGSISGLDIINAHVSSFQNFRKSAQERTGISNKGESNISGTIMNCEFIAANGTFYLIKRDRWNRHTDNVISSLSSWGKKITPTKAQIKKIAIAIIALAIVGLLYVYWPEIKTFFEKLIPETSKHEGGESELGDSLNSRGETDSISLETGIVMDDAVTNESKEEDLEEAKRKAEEAKKKQDEEERIKAEKEAKEKAEKEAKEKSEKENQDQIFETAVKNNDVSTLERLANNGYTKAYSKLATIYLDKQDFNKADNYARKALNSGVGRMEAIKVIEILDGYGRYENGEHGGKPKY